MLIQRKHTHNVILNLMYLTQVMWRLILNNFLLSLVLYMCVNIYLVVWRLYKLFYYLSANYFSYKDFKVWVCSCLRFLLYFSNYELIILTCSFIFLFCFCFKFHIYFILTFLEGRKDMIQDGASNYSRGKQIRKKGFEDCFS